MNQNALWNSEIYCPLYFAVISGSSTQLRETTIIFQILTDFFDFLSSNATVRIEELGLQ